MDCVRDSIATVATVRFGVVRVSSSHVGIMREMADTATMLTIKLLER